MRAVKVDGQLVNQSSHEDDLEPKWSTIVKYTNNTVENCVRRKKIINRINGIIKPAKIC